MLPEELQLGRYGRLLEEVFNEYSKYPDKQSYNFFLVQKARNHMKISELFQTWSILNLLEYLNSSQFDQEYKDFLK